MIDKQINGSEPEDLNTTFTAHKAFEPADVIELTKLEVLKVINKYVDELEDRMVDLGVDLENKYYFRAGTMNLVDALREELE